MYLPTNQDFRNTFVNKKNPENGHRHFDLSGPSILEGRRAEYSHSMIAQVVKELLTLDFAIFLQRYWRVREHEDEDSHHSGTSSGACGLPPGNQSVNQKTEYTFSTNNRKG
jgi:hypothetical protein